MAITFRNNIGAYTGVGRKLTIAEADGNIFDLLERVIVIEGAAGKQILNITYSGSAITVNYTDSTSDGPFPLPIATFNPVGPWLNSTPYAYLDVVTVVSRGTYVCMVPHTSPPFPELFDPAATDESTDANLLWLPIAEARDVDNDIAFSMMGILPSVTGGLLIGQYVVIRDLIMQAPLNLGRAYLDTDGDVSIELEKNGATIGIIEFSAGNNVGAITFSSDVEFTIGDRVAARLISTDEVAADLSVTLPMRRTDI